MSESCLTDCVLIEMVSPATPLSALRPTTMPGGFPRSPSPLRGCRMLRACPLSTSQLTLSLLKYSEVVKTLTKNANISKLITVECLDAVHHAVAEGKITSAAKGGMQYSIITKVGFEPPFCSKDNPETDGPCYAARGLASGE